MPHLAGSLELVVSRLKPNCAPSSTNYPLRPLSARFDRVDPRSEASRLPASPAFSEVRQSRPAKRGEPTTNWRQRRPGFTLIELLVVIAIIGILATFVVASFTGAQARARDAKRKSDLDAIKKALQMYYNDRSSYPAYGDWSFIRSTCPTIPWGWNTCETTNDLRTDLTPYYIKVMPVDPTNKDFASAANRGYLYQGSTNSYTIYTHLENESDQNINCPTGCGYMNFANYKIENP